MKLDEFAFLNQQLAAMLREGIPLEGALRRLCAEMRAGTLRSELEKLEGDLARGTPLAEALAARQLPDLYQRMLLVGARSNDMPGVLTLLADYYQRRQALGTRLKGLMVYPAIVLASAFLLSCALAYVLASLVWPNMASLISQGSAPTAVLVVWMPPVVLGLAVAALGLAAAVPSLRRAVRWRIPAFHEASLSQTAAALAVLLKSGVPLGDALALVERLEGGTRAGAEIALWRQRLAAGHGRFAEMAPEGQVFPPLFVWMVAHGGEDLAGGFQRAAEVYQARAAYRAELLLYSALPCSILALGVMIVTQVAPVLSAFVTMLNALGS